MFCCFVSRLITGIAILLCSLSVQASVVVDATRIVYPAKEREVSLRLSNKGQQAALVQTWIDDGRVDAKPDEVDTPFIVMPPMVRIDPDKGQSLRIAFVPSTNLPKDRESVFWLNVLDVPPLASAQVGNHMQLAFRTRLKLFFRPANLPGSAAESAEKLRWNLSRSGKNTVLQVHNDGAFHVSFNSVELKLKNGRVLTVKSHMVAPKSSADFVFEQSPNTSDFDVSVMYEWINDFGANMRAEAKLQ
ncbi:MULTISPECIES: fimbria/pilus periplasmic chaperone [Pseudomonas chlororaphis group]|uniref:fimbria/pilus periplasmic chaperone n=1 Tax=Pseudomonas chlororaphis group TaxID=136842 RepID=UPI00209837C7|nr:MULTISPECIES: fimbria/pilus periplasmic chaperone [Pseudomonas chlororaphis group]MCO7579452.1 fimbria/pilus periplasmic chaperone [Pseudomonas protegens]MCO7584849.1 fimbria/pilus periplasmic chaperone [Pseudomonas chlororaphis]MCO7602359.1 fimbria/pilus periplasmic chaperone [Pseudomonas chlororaphis]